MTPRNAFYEFLDICRATPTPRIWTPVFAKLRDDEVKKYKWAASLHCLSMTPLCGNSEAAALNSGAILEATVQRGEGDATPQEGSLVYFHFSLYRSDAKDNAVFSTRPEDETTEGCPFAAVLMKSPRLPRAWEMALLGMFVASETRC